MKADSTQEMTTSYESPVARMNVLIVQNDAKLGQFWQRHLQRHDHVADVVQDQDSAIVRLQEQFYPIIILDVVLDGGSAIAVADYASFRHPDARVIFVTNAICSAMTTLQTSCKIRTARSFGFRNSSTRLSFWTWCWMAEARLPSQIMPAFGIPMPA